MRSKLEVSWAMLFDKLGFKWEYEPVMLPGWIPDFGLKRNDGSMIYCEVKPFDFVKFEDANLWEHENKMDYLSSVGYKKAIKNASLKNPVILLGQNPFYTKNEAHQLCLGFYFGNPFSPSEDVVLGPMFDLLAIKRDYNTPKWGISCCWGNWCDLLNYGDARQVFLYRGCEEESIFIKHCFPFAKLWKIY